MGKRRTIDWPRHKPFPQSPSGLTPERRDAILERYLAGVPIGQLEAESGLHRSTIWHHARTQKMRKKDHPDAVRLRKGPAPAQVVLADGSVRRLVCADLAFAFDREDPGATVDAILDQAGAAAGEGRWTDYGRSMRMADLTRRVMANLAPRRRSVAVIEAAEPEEAARAPHVLRPAQTPPPGDWRTWLFLGGRGAGKTLAGAEWLADQAEALGAGGRLALIGPTLHDVREVMIEGVSGVRSLPRWTRADRPRFQPSRRRLYFANGCVAYAFSAEDPDSLRGPQFSAAWADEFCAWPSLGARGAGETLAMLRLGLRLPGPVRASDSLLGRGQKASPSRPDAAWDDAERHPPRLVVTTTPKPTRALARLREEATCVTTHAATAENADNLSPGFVDDLRALYGGTRREAQELEGKVVDLEGALFTAEMMMKARSPSPSRGGWSRSDRVGTADGSPSVGREAVEGPPPPRRRLRDGDPPRDGEGEGKFERVVVAVDPTATASGDACGIVAAGARRRADGRREAVVLADRTVSGLTPDQWARRVVATAREFGAHGVIAEVNQGGDMVRTTLRTVGCTVPVREVRATKGKRIRAEPVAALYEQGRVRHAGAFDALEEELMAFGGELETAGSLDRADALVWAITDLLVDRGDGERGPRVRRL